MLWSNQINDFPRFKGSVLDTSFSICGKNIFDQIMLRKHWVKPSWELQKKHQCKASWESVIKAQCQKKSGSCLLWHKLWQPLGVFSDLSVLNRVIGVICGDEMRYWIKKFLVMFLFDDLHSALCAKLIREGFELKVVQKYSASRKNDNVVRNSTEMF